MAALTGLLTGPATSPNLDVANWYLDAHPLSAVGFGHRAQRVAGNMSDFFSVDLEYPNGVHIHSMCRQVSGCWNWFGEEFTYKKTKPAEFQPTSPDPYEAVGYDPSDYVSEHAPCSTPSSKARS